MEMMREGLLQDGEQAGTAMGGTVDRGDVGTRVQHRPRDTRRTTPVSPHVFAGVSTSSSVKLTAAQGEKEDLRW